MASVERIVAGIQGRLETIEKFLALSAGYETIEEAVAALQEERGIVPVDSGSGGVHKSWAVPASAPGSEPEPVAQDTGEDEVAVENMRVADLKVVLDNAGVPYPADSKKAELVALVESLDGE